MATRGINRENDNPLICCWMYAFTSELRSAWAALFQNLGRCLPEIHNTQFTIAFEDKPGAFHQKNLFLGHTCGYPFATRLWQTHRLVCVPEFDIEGAKNGFYSSWVIANRDSTGNALSDFRHHRVAINNRDSNSGMNVLRHAVAPLAQGRPFFKEVQISGSHLTSIKMVENGSADLAAIDAVTYHFAQSANMVNEDRIKVIDQSEQTLGLPFVAGISSF